MTNETDKIVPAFEAANASARSTTETLLGHIAPIAESCGAEAIFVCIDALDGHALPPVAPAKSKVFYVTRMIVEGAEMPDDGAQFLRVPDVPFTRLGQVKIALFLALSRGFVKQGDKIVFLSGIASSGNLDTIIVTEVGREYEIFATSGTDPETPPHIQPQVIERVVDIASELGKEGREGKHIGALFVVGDTEHVMPLTRQLILNPFKGYPEDQRNALDPTLEETIKELAGLDGAFIIRGDGIIESCGTYLKTASQEQFELPRGLGSRHHAAAAITAVTDSIAITVSQSTGTVTIFRSGSIITEIEKPRSLGEKPPASSTPEPAVPQKPKLARKPRHKKCA
jgi:DNA integrity scanning protein DisA with diadenylate cyclase activity